MSHRHPKFRPNDGDILNVDAMDALRPYQEELAGRLDGSNFSAGAWAAVDDLEVSTQMEVTSETGEYTMTFGGAGGSPEAMTNRRLYALQQWVTLPTGSSTVLSRTFTLANRAMVIAIASFHVMMIDESDDEYPNALNANAAMLWAIRVDGVVRFDGGLGGDTQLDYPGDERAFQSPVVRAAVILDPGSHTVDVVGFATRQFNVTQFPEIGDHELIIMALNT